MCRHLYYIDVGTNTVKTDLSGVILIIYTLNINMYTSFKDTLCLSQSISDGYCLGYYAIVFIVIVVSLGNFSF